jgi:large subunit ribosomal protein L13
MSKKVHIIDATNKSFGRVASEVAKILMGKHKEDYLPYQEKGDFVEVINLEKAKFTGKKFEKKEYYYHTGYPGHLKVKKLKELWLKDPKKVFKHAVYHMLPKNKLRKLMMKKLIIR